MTSLLQELPVIQKVRYEPVTSVVLYQVSCTYPKLLCFDV